MKFDYVIGIDEVGRGALAGPLVVVAATFSPEARLLIRRLKLKDSKKLSPKRRIEIFEAVGKNPWIRWSAARVSPSVIDRLNVSQAANLAASRALIRLLSRQETFFEKPKIILDGGLRLRDNLLFKNGLANLSSETLIKADDKIKSVMLASIIAKVIRDRRMINYHKHYPSYGFDVNKGYGTRIHISALKQNGFSEIHRQSFLRKYF
ncbi:MAG TPA: ribonuclease HII [Candidatus Tyrphobacter sp.]|nr:ribonuclease HII [Candidatus Tyrphobacter sp.]